MLKWEMGRSGGGYQKMVLLDCQWPIRWDLHLMKVPEGCEILNHTDPVKGLRHFRLNVVLKKPRMGGEFICKKAIINSSRVKLFRPDLHEHSVSRVESGSRICLSMGWTMHH